MYLKWKLVFGFRLFIAGGGIVRNCLVFIDPQEPCIGADKAFIENAAGKLLKMLAFQSFKMTPGYFRGLCDFIQGDPAHLPFTTKPVTKSTHGSSIAFCC